MDPNPDIHLREYLELRIDYVRDAIITRLDLERRAIEKQDIENLRRLDELNHASEAALAKELSFLPRETWEQFVKDLDDWKQMQRAERGDLVTTKMHGVLEGRLDLMSSRLDIIDRFIANMSGRLWAFGAGLSILVIILNWVIRASPKP